MAMPTKAPTKFEEYRQGLTDDEIYEQKREDIMVVVKQVADERIRVKLTQCQTDALISFFFNTGAGINSVYKLLNSCDFNGLASKMREYNKVRDPRTKKLALSPGLDERRREEAEMLLHCTYPQGEPAIVPCCTYKLTKTYTNVAPGKYQARCKRSCKLGEDCYGI